MINNLVGQTVKHSPQNRREGGNNTRTLYIIHEFTEESKRRYMVQDTDTMAEFPACADTYDKLFLRSAEAIKSKAHQKGGPKLNPSHPDFKLKS